MKLNITPSRILNDEKGIFGLWMTDLAAGVGIFVVLSVVLDGSSFAVCSLPVAILSLVPLSPLRLSTRRHIIRDAVSYWLTSKKLFDLKKHVYSRD